ncbi:hypothetical protein ACE3NQ_23535 [Paenibacillus terreus]|uniref:DUF4179 domain-containing protein n=1 Tax=Paenibacillus terreus TaxID=1387834 RepID=A0ABV5BEM4_9BACL
MCKHTTEENAPMEELQHTLNQFEAPQSLHTFAQNITVHAAGTSIKRRRPRRSMLYTGLAAGCTAAVAISLLTAQVSPAFASVMNNIPGFAAASEWLSSKRDSDGVQNAQLHNYQPSEPEVYQIGDATVSIGDVYLTSDKLIYKTFVRSDKIKNHLITDSDGSYVDPWASFHAVSLDFPGKGGGAQDVIFDEDTKEPILVDTSEIAVTPQEVDAFLRKNPSELKFALYEQNGTDSPDKHEISVKFDKSQWKEDRTFVVHQSLDVEGVPEIQTLTVDQVKVTPINTFVDLQLNNMDKFLLETQLAEPTINLTDDQGNRYPLDTYLPLDEEEGRYESGKIRLVFSSSPYFNDALKKLTLHIDELEVSEIGSFSLSMNEALPKTISFKGKEMTITDADYKDGMLNLKIKQSPDNRQGVSFSIPSYEAKVLRNHELYQKLYVEQEGYRKGKLRVKDGQEEYEISIMAPKQDDYDIEMVSERRAVPLNKEMDIDLK